MVGANGVVVVVVAGRVGNVLLGAQLKEDVVTSCTEDTSSVQPSQPLGLWAQQSMAQWLGFA